MPESFPISTSPDRVTGAASVSAVSAVSAVDTSSSTVEQVDTNVDTNVDIKDSVKGVLLKIDSYFSVHIFREISNVWTRIRNVFTDELTRAITESHLLITEIENDLYKIKSKL